MASEVPTFAVPPGFLGTGRRAGAAVSIAGIPLDIGTTNRSGARFGPQAIRQASRMLVDGAHPTTGMKVSELLSDIGDFRIALGDIAASLTLALLRALARRNGPLGLIHFDAHVDTWPDNFGQPYAHGSVFYHAIEENLVDPRRMIQIGIRSPVEREVLDWTVGRGVTVVTAQDTHEQGPAAVAERARSVVGAAPCYLSFDIDALDPAFAPGTGTPEIGGLASWQAQSILRRLTGLRFLGMDVVEVAPAYDVAEITSLAAATLVYEYLALAATRLQEGST
jgi:agmatinase